jgi:hypothetical protein
LQLVSWVAKTCTDMSRLVAHTSHPVNDHYNSNLDTFLTNLVYPACDAHVSYYIVTCGQSGCTIFPTLPHRR